MFSFSHKKFQKADVEKIVAMLRNRKPPQNPVEKMVDKLDEWVKKQTFADQILVKKEDDAIELQIKEKLLFSSGDYHVQPEGRRALGSLSEVLKKIPEPYHLGIEGHTDDNPIHSDRIENNWDLSSKRALAVLGALQLPDSLLKRTQLVAHAEMNPIAPNRDGQGRPLPENQLKNRRVSLRVFP
jgi:chemotaxis protein MotB